MSESLNQMGLKVRKCVILDYESFQLRWGVLQHWSIEQFNVPSRTWILFIFLFWNSWSWLYSQAHNKIAAAIPVSTFPQGNKRKKDDFSLRNEGSFPRNLLIDFPSCLPGWNSVMGSLITDRWQGVVELSMEESGLLLELGVLWL